MYNLQTYSLVKSEGCSVSEPDALRYYALQWTALNNRTAAAQYIVEHGGDIAACDHTGQTALHWSSVRSAIQVAELLLHEGARVSAADSNGYQIKELQKATRTIQTLCSEAKGSKQTAITEKIPATKRSVERFLFHVKSFLYTTPSGCSFWMGNLKHKDLMGQLVSSLLG